MADRINNREGMLRTIEAVAAHVVTTSKLDAMQAYNVAWDYVESNWTGRENNDAWIKAYDAFAARRTWQWVKGTDVRVGDQVLGSWKEAPRVVQVVQRQLPEGARYADLHLDTGEIRQAWEGFETRVLR